jgi:hypothetical protein
MNEKSIHYEVSQPSHHHITFFHTHAIQYLRSRLLNSLLPTNCDRACCVVDVDD